MKRLLPLALTALAALPTSADAAPRVLSTKEIVESCRLTDQGDHKAFCVGYFSATYDTYLVTRHPELAKAFICPTQPAPRRDELIGDFVKWSEANSKYDNDPAADNILRFLGHRFPCSK